MRIEHNNNNKNKSKLELYIVRHGQTYWNAEGKLQGNVDIELNENGREIAGRYGEELEDVKFDKIFSSPLIRAYETACLIRGHRNIQIIRDERLKEISFGDKEGSSYKEWMEETSPYRFFFSEPGKYDPPENGETISSVIARTHEFMEEVIEPLYEKYERIMIVAHGALNKGLMCHIEGNTQNNFWGDGLQNNCQATIFTYDGENWTRK